MPNIEKTAKNQGFQGFTNEELVEKIRSGEDTDGALMQRLYEKNLPMIRKFVKPYTASGVEMADLEQQAFFGLVNAVRRFESSENVLFLTYARYWIVAEVRKYVQKCGSLLHVSASDYSNIGKYQRMVNQYEMENGYSPTGDEVANMLQLTVDDLDRIRTLASGISSLDTPIGEVDGDLTLCDTVADAVNIEEAVVDDLYNDNLKNIWNVVGETTTASENEILRDYFLNGISMADIAKRRGVSVQRISQIKEMGLCRLRMGKALKKLLEDYEVSLNGLYRTGFNSYNNRNFTSIPEHIAIRRLELKESCDIHIQNVQKSYDDRMKEIEKEMDAKRKEVEERCAVKRRNVNDY